MRIRTRRVPAGYRELEYIESTGTQYINLGIKGNQNSRALIDFQATTTENPLGIYKRLFGSRNNPNSLGFFISTNPTAIYFDYGDNHSTTTTVQLDTKRHLCDFSNKFYIDGELITSYSVASSFSTPTNLLLFAANASNGITGWFWKIYGFKLYESTNLLRNLVPCERLSDNKPGMYDTVNNVFYVNSGSGEFVKGPYKDSYYIPVVITEGTTNLGGTSKDYSNKADKAVETADGWGGDTGTCTYHHSGGYNNYPYKVYDKTGTGTGGIYKKTANDITIEAGKTYTMSVYVRATKNLNGISAYSFNINRGSDNHYINYGQSFSITTKWQRLVKTFTAASNEGGLYGEMSIIYGNGADYSVYYSGFQIEEKDHATMFVDGTRSDNTVKIGSPKIRLLPVEYQGVEYIESSGTQYIDTGVSIGDKYEFVLDQLNNFDTNNHYMCGSSTAGKMLGTLSNVLWSNGLIYTNVTFNRNVREKIGLKVSITNSSGADYVATNYTTNKNMTGHSSYTPSGSSTVLLFRVGSLYEKFKCYNFKLYKDEQLARNMIPCYRKSDNVIGLYDTVTRTFYTNSGTGTFAKGADKDYII